MAQLLTALCALLCFPFLLAAQDDPARLDATKEFVKYFKKVQDEPLMVEAIMTLKGNECRPAAEELMKLLKHPSAAVQQAALSVLETYKTPATYETWIAAMPKMKDQEQMAITVKVLGRAQVKSAVPVIEQVASDGKATPVLKFEAARALQAIGDPGSKGLLAAFASDKEPVVRMAAVDAMGALKMKDQGKSIALLLKDPEWQVQAAAITAVGILRPQEAVQPLIDLMRKDGRLKVECSEALFRLTTWEFGIDADKWQEQWNVSMSIAGWRIPTDEELAKKAESRKKYDALYGKTDKVTTFAKIPTTSVNVLFIIDVSGSMDDLVVEVDKFSGYRDRRRFTIVQTELLNTIESLSPDTNFDILSFATDIKPWKGRLCPANVVNKDSAKAWVRGLQPLGGKESQDLAAAGLGGSAALDQGKTNTLKALLYAFGVDPDKPGKATVTGFDKNAIKSPLDTVYFLSDGRPSVGKLIETNEILKEVRKHNEVFRMVIHTIAIGDFTKDFLKQLAEENGGVFIDMGR